MKYYDSLTINQSKEFSEGVTIKGKADFKAEVTVPSLHLDGELISTSNLIVGKDGFKGKGILNIAGFVQSNSNFEFEGKLTLNELKSKNVILKGNVSANTLNIENHCTISIRTLEDLTVNEMIKSKTLQIELRSFYTKWLELPSKILRVFGKRRKFKRKFMLPDINFICEKFIFVSRYLPDSIEIEFPEGNISTISSFEIKQALIP